MNSDSNKNGPTKRTMIQRLLVMIGCVGFVIGAAGVGPVHAATSWTHNNAYGYSIMKNTPSYSGGAMTAYVWNDTAVTMICWTDTAWVYDRSYSNYNSPRWFRVRINANGQVGYVHSSYVYYQSSVPHC